MTTPGADQAAPSAARCSARVSTRPSSTTQSPSFTSTRIAFAITKPDAGTNSHNLSTAARRSNGSYLLRGTKYYISGVEDAVAILVIARRRDQDGSLGLPIDLSRLLA